VGACSIVREVGMVGDSVLRWSALRCSRVTGRGRGRDASTVHKVGRCGDGLRSTERFFGVDDRISFEQWCDVVVGLGLGLGLGLDRGSFEQ
jgi:hypothetical protein